VEIVSFSFYTVNYMVNIRKERMLLICAECGETLIYVLDEERNVLEIFPCICQEMELFELQKNWFPNYTQLA